jgi:hypothetical protein
MNTIASEPTQQTTTAFRKGAENKIMKRRFGPTKNGVRRDNSTNLYVLNKYIGGRTYNDPTPHKEFRSAVEWAEKFATEKRELRDAAEAILDPNAKLAVVIERWKFDVNVSRATQPHKKNRIGCLSVLLDHWPAVPDVSGKPRKVRFDQLRPTQVSLSDLNAWKTFVLDAKGLLIVT